MTTASPPAEATNGQKVLWAFEQLNTRSVENLRQFWDASTYERFPDRECRGADEIAAYFEGVFAALPDFHMEVVNIAEQNDDVYVHWKLSGTHTGAAFQGIDATGRRIEIDGIDHFILRDGTVVSNFVVFDQLQFARAIGFVPPDGSPADRVAKGAFNARTKLLARVRRRWRSARRSGAARRGRR